MKVFNKLILFPWLLTVVVVVVMMGCSSPQNGGPEEPDNDTTGDASSVYDEDPLTNTDPDLIDEDPDPEPTQSYGTGSGRLRIKVTAGSKAATGKVRILTAAVEPEFVDEGPASRTFDLQAGAYDVEVTLTTTLDQPEKRLSAVPVKGGDVTERDVDFVVGTIKLQPMRGRSKVKSKVRWRYMGGGDWFEKTSHTGEWVTLSAGRYDAEIKVGRTEIVISDIQVYDAKRTISPPVTMGGR